MTAREEILSRIRTGLGARNFTPAPPVLLNSAPDTTDRVQSLLHAASALAAQTYHADSPAAALAYVQTALRGRHAVASNSPFLHACGITELKQVQTHIRDREVLRALCAVTGCGITSADYALANTGTLVMVSSNEEARMISLLPPAHIAVIPEGCILADLDELLTVLPKPADRTSSMVLITGPSRTGDIEQNLVRGVHGPGELHLVVVSAQHRNTSATLQA